MEEANKPEILSKIGGATDGRECFFTEAAFLRVMGPGPTLEDRLHSLASRPLTEKKKTKIKLQFDRSILQSSLQHLVPKKSKGKQSLCRETDAKIIESLKNDDFLKCDETKKSRFLSSCGSVEQIGKKNQTNEFIIKEKSSHEKNFDEMETISQCIEYQVNQEFKKNVSEILETIANVEDGKSHPGADVAIKDGSAASSNFTATFADFPSQNDETSPDKVDSSSVSIPCNGGDTHELSEAPVDSTVSGASKECCDLVSNMADTPASPDPNEEDVEELCCLVMKSQSSDDENSDEDGTQSNIMSCRDWSGVKNYSQIKMGETKEEKLEDAFYLVSPSVLSDEQSSKEDKADYYRLHSLNGNPATKSVHKSKTSASAVVKNSLEVTTAHSISTEPDTEMTQSGMTLNVQGREQLSRKPENVKPSAVQQVSSERIESTLSSVKLPTPNGVSASQPCISVPEEKEDTSAGPSTEGHNGTKTQEGKGRIYQDLRSELSKNEHKRYVQLYKKHVCPMMKGNRKPNYSEAELRELVELEDLQHRVSKEQVTYQEYLKDKAEKNFNAYNFLQNLHRIYSHSRYNSFHRPKNYIRNFENNGILDIPLVLEDKTSSTFMNFKKILLKLGSSPGITLPDIKDGSNPVQIELETNAVTALFPSSTRLSDVQSIDHMMISEDSNAKVLAEQEKVDVVLSSSSFKCLMDNHASDVMRTWHIPVFIQSKYGHKTVYLDKPLHRDDLPVRDYNAMYYKYALRSFVSRPRRQKNKRDQPDKSNPGGRPSEITSNRRDNSFLADDLDMFSTESPCDIETFGSGTLSQKKIRTSATSSMCSEGFDWSAGRGENKSDEASSNVIARVTRSKGKFEKNKIQLDANVSRGSSGSAVMQDKSMNESPASATKLGDAGEKSLRSRTISSLPNSKPSTEEPPLKVAKMDPKASTHSRSEICMIDVKNKQVKSSGDHSLIPSRCIPRQVPSTSKNVTPSFSTDSSRSAGALNSAVSFKAVSSASPSAEFANSSASCFGDKKLTGSGAPTFIVPLSTVTRSPSFLQEKSVPSLLDSILGPSSAPKEKSRSDRNLRYAFEEDFIPLAETCNTVTYNLWELGSLRVILRCNGHGTLKDKTKPRYVYLSPKMEYQPDAGMEQVTLSEMTKAWAACFIRPTTNFIRVRINAFTSEILMTEELTIDRILNPSLPFKPDHSLDVLRRLFEQLRSLPDGQYLLSHFKGHKDCSVRKFHGKSSLMAGPKKKRTGKAKAGQVPWIPIDPTILTPSHIQNHRIPATFLPSDWVKTFKKNHHQEKGNGQNQHKGKGGKGGKQKAKKGKWKNRQQELI